MGVSIAYFIVSFLCLPQEPFIRYGDPLSLVLYLALPKDVHAWRKRLYAGSQDFWWQSLVPTASTPLRWVPGCRLI